MLPKIEFEMHSTLMVWKWRITILCNESLYNEQKRCCLSVTIILSHLCIFFVFTFFVCLLCFFLFTFHTVTIGRGRKSITKITIAYSSVACNAYTIFSWHIEYWKYGIWGTQFRNSQASFHLSLIPLIRYWIIVFFLNSSISFDVYHIFFRLAIKKCLNSNRIFFGALLYSKKTYLHYMEFVR